MSKKIKIFTDGGARGNPGPAGIGVVVDGKKFSRFVGERTNNQAEYEAVIFALQQAKKMGAEEADCFLDSELVVNQLNRKFKVKDKDLAPLFVKVWNLTFNFKKVNFFYISREKNKEADKLVNLAINRATKYRSP